MNAYQFDDLVRRLPGAASRRGVLRTGFWAMGGTALAAFGARTAEDVDAKKKKKKKKKKVTLCHEGQTIAVNKKAKKKHLKHGDTSGPCPATPVCTPACGNQCGTDDGCGGICACAAGSLCHAGTCHPCTVSCGANSTTCGEDLQTSLAAGGTFYICPGRYIGNFALNLDSILIGAGEGEDPASNTILDANESGRVVQVNSGIIAALQRLRLTGGNAPGFNTGGGILNIGTVTVTACTIARNRANFGGGVAQTSAATGAMTLSGCTVTDNSTSDGFRGGIAQLGSSHAVTLNNCVVSGNKTSSSQGGGIYTNTSVAITSTAISGNTAASDGGGIYNAAGAVTFDSASSVTGNTAIDEGGGIFNQTGLVNLNGANVSGNDPDNCAGDPVAGCIEE